MAWGGAWPPPKGAGNFADLATQRAKGGYSCIDGYEDGFPFTAPVGSFPADKFGLHDLAGNAWEWCEDWYDGAHGAQKFRVLRGGGWGSGGRNYLRSSFRLVNGPTGHAAYYGFRSVLAKDAAGAGK